MPRFLQGLVPARVPPAGALQASPAGAEFAGPTGAPGASGAAGGLALPSDIEIGFNALDASHRLVEAIDQSQIKIEDDPLDHARFFKRQRVVRHVDFEAAVMALNYLSATQLHEVEAAYAAYEGRSLAQDLFGRGESGVGTDLSVDQIHRLEALLQGTVASSPEDAEAAAKHQLEGDVAELHALLHGRTGPAEIERAMSLLRRGAEEVSALQDEYDLNYDLRTDLMRLGLDQALRGMLLLSGSSLAADAYIVNLARWRIVAIDAELRSLQPVARDAPAVFKQVFDSPSVFESAQRLMRIKQLGAQRKAQVLIVEQRVTTAAAEALQDAEGQGIVETDARVRGRVAAVLGTPGEVAHAVGGAEGRLIDAVAGNDPVRIVAAQMRKLHRDGKLDTDAIASALRGLRAQALLQTQRHLSDASAEGLEAAARELADVWFTRLSQHWDAGRVGADPGFDALLSRGDKADVDLKRGLYASRGQLGEADELVRALAGRRRDIEMVKRVLRHKSAAQMAELKLQYRQLTRQSPQWPDGRELEADLFKAAPPGPGESLTSMMLHAQGLAPGKAVGSDRLLLEDYLQRPAQEGGLEEVGYVVARAEREYRYTLDNRGVTGWWRDAWGNEARSLLDATIVRVRQLHMEYMLHTGWGRNQDAMKSDRARRIVRDMNLARATLRGDRAGYERATAELRATFQAAASFALQAVLTAVLAPLGTALFAARMAQAGVTMARIAQWTRGVALNMASTISANRIAYGQAYDTEMLLADLRGGLVGALGSAGAGRLLAPVATRLEARLGKVLGQEFVAGASSYAGMQAVVLIEGGEALGFIDFLGQHIQGKAGDALTHGTHRVQHLVSPQSQALAQRKPTGPIDPVDAGIPPEWSHAYRQLADQYGLIVKVRPLSKHAGLRRNSSRIKDGGPAVPKVEIIKAKSVNDLDLLIGAPDDSLGLVALFQPTRPARDLPPALRKQAMQRYRDRRREFRKQIGEIKALEKQGLVKLDGGVVKVFDPRLPDEPASRHGGFRPMAGDADLFDITHADGAPLTKDQRVAVTAVLRAMDIGVEHGAHAWWLKDSKETYDRRSDTAIRNEHTSKQQLAAFVPGGEVLGVWVDTRVTAAPRLPGQRLLPPLSSLKVVEPSSAAAGPGMADDAAF